MRKQKLVLIGGPTGVGKTALAIILANLFDGEIISCDSVAIYKHLDIGSAKPDNIEQSQAKHHLIDIKEPNEDYSTAEFRQDAEKVIEELSQKNKLPIICGGTGLYMKTLLFPLELGNSDRSDEIRNKYKALAEKHGNDYVLDLLRQVDEESASKLHAKDLKRIIRALEIFELTGKKKSSFQTQLESKYDYMLIFLNDERSQLYERINRRVDIMLNNGLVEEVRHLVEDLGVSKDCLSMSAIGYKEVLEYLENKVSYEEMSEKIKLNSRHYAKRQLTWFKAMPNVKEYNCKNIDAIVADVKSFLN